MAGVVISCFCQNLLFRLYFAIKTSIFKLRPLLRSLCLINSFYRRCVCCIHNRSNGSNRFSTSNRSSISHYFPIISPLLLIISSLFPHYFVIISLLFFTISQYSYTISYYFSLFLHYFTLH